MAVRERPLSPHLQVYRPQITSVLSILHRITGIVLGVGTLVLIYWLVAAAQGPEAYAVAQDWIGSWIGRLALFGWTLAFFYHLANGIRHLAWDAGWGFELDSVQKSGIATVAAAGGLTVLAWILAYVFMG